MKASKLAAILHTKIDWNTINQINKLLPGFAVEMEVLEAKWEKNPENLMPSEGGTGGHATSG